MTVVAILRAARAHIATPERWTQGAFARTADGVRCPAYDTTATCWCIGGAVLAVAAFSDKRADALFALHQAAGKHQHIGVWNDVPARTHAEVLAILDCTIAAFEKEQP